MFYKYGRIVHIKLPRCNHPPAFAFIEFEDKRDAEDAQYYRDGYEFDGNRLRVRLVKGRLVVVALVAREMTGEEEEEEEEEAGSAAAQTREEEEEEEEGRSNARDGRSFASW